MAPFQQPPPGAVSTMATSICPGLVTPARASTAVPRILASDETTEPSSGAWNIATGPTRSAVNVEDLTGS